MVIDYKKGDVTDINDKINNILIVHICNDVGLWGAGFVLYLSKKWPVTKEKYLSMDHVMGNIEFVKVENNIVVCNMIAQKNVNKRHQKFIRRVDYEVLRGCLKQVSDFCVKYNCRLHMPKIGSGLAGGDWGIIENIIKETINENVIVCVYEL